ncbi:MAG: hypothetical protein H6734_06285 [Alphaproteobacteria bacterium]|nr:hypothetical protein [Alphaproteobacteria bacterium]
MSAGTLATPACDEVVEDVRKELSAARAEVASLELELYGEPIPWPHDVEPRMTEDAFRRTMDEVLAECWPDAKMTQMDCAEPPCMAVLFDAGDPSDCPAWTRTHGIAAGMSTRPVDCGGEQKRMTILLPPSGKYATVDEMMAASGKEDPAVQENFTRRFMARTRDLHLDAPCPE